MSSFLSNKFLAIRSGVGERPLIETDLPCPMCDYNLRGLRYGGNCPECGERIRKETEFGDPLTSGGYSQQNAMRLGLLLVTGCVFLGMAARLWIFVMLVGFQWPPARKIYMAMGLMLGVAWVVGVWMLTPSTMNAQYRKWSWLRLSSRLLAVCWCGAFGLWGLAMANPAPGGSDALPTWGAVLLVLGFVGSMLFAGWLLRLACDAELEDSARRINLGLWALPIASLLVAISPSEVSWFELVWVVVIMLVWCWYMLALARGVLGLQRHVSWHMKLRESDSKRSNRVQAMRGEIDEEVAARVRPTGPALSDVPLIDPRARK